ncbi:Multisite-specific tRNA:(cytosine-C(5))-methyltransferase trm4b [Diplonema papillatum]|nr:Multisite-specific tRNA:(cytosine-C(5))-methyltransferase trm4b [Diplonema papillatum]
MGGGRKRPRDEDPTAAKLLSGLTDIRKVVDMEAFVGNLIERAGNKVDVDAALLKECLVASALQQEGSPATEGEPAAATFSDDILDLAMRKAKRAKKGDHAYNEAPVSELVWLFKHHGVQRTAQDRLDARKATGNKATVRSEHFERYYKEQQIVPEEEWDAFMASLRTALPMTMRLTSGRPYMPRVQQELRETFFEATPPSLSPITWYPQAFSCSHETYHAEEHASLQDWCKRQNSLGTAAYQEAASLIPPILLDVEPHHLVLDLCSAPGSKALQCADTMLSQAQALQANDPSHPGLTGGIISNEYDAKKAYQVLPGRLKRTHCKCIVVTQSDARLFPNMYERIDTDGELSAKRLFFDRVMADVPCSGDGTGRKDHNIWSTWSTNYSLSLHPRQVQILLRGLDCLKVGGILVYSTCSLNPIEDEAVVAAALAARFDEVRVIKGNVPETLRTQPGVKRWGVPDGSSLVWSKPEDCDLTMLKAKGWTATMFSPTKGDSPHAEDVMAQLPLTHRILPHHNNTSGFYVAVFQKFHSAPKNEAPPRLPRRDRPKPTPKTAPEVKPVHETEDAQPAKDEPAVQEGEQKSEPNSQQTIPSNNAAPAVSSEGAPSKVEPAAEEDFATKNAAAAQLVEAEKDKERQGNAVGGMRNARQFYWVYSEEDTSWQTFASWFGVSKPPVEAFGGLRCLFQMDERDRSIRKKMFLATEGAVRILHALVPATQTNHIKAVTIGCRAVTLIKGSYLSSRCPCPYRPAYETAPVLAMASSLRKLYLTTSDAVKLLDKKELLTSQTTDVLEQTGNEQPPVATDLSQDHWVGPCLVGLKHGLDITADNTGNRWDQIWIPTILLVTKLEANVEDHERVGLLDLLKRCLLPSADP